MNYHLNLEAYIWRSRRLIFLKPFLTDRWQERDEGDVPRAIYGSFFPAPEHPEGATKLEINELERGEWEGAINRGSERLVEEAMRYIREKEVECSGGVPFRNLWSRKTEKTKLYTETVYGKDGKGSIPVTRFETNISVDDFMDDDPCAKDLAMNKGFGIYQYMHMNEDLAQEILLKERQ